LENALKRSTFFLLILLIACGCASADDLQWGGTYVAAWSGFGTSPYTAIDTSANNKLVTIFCLDFNDEIAPPTDWQANIRPLTADNVMDFAQFGGNYGNGITAAPFAFQSDSLTLGDPHSIDLSASPTAYIRYQEATWLFGNILKALPNGDINSSIISQVAVWDLFVEGPNQSTLTNDIKAYNGPSGYTFNNYLYSTDNYSTPPATQSMGGLQFEDAVDEALKAAQNAVLNESWTSSNYVGTWDLVTGDPTWAAAYGRPVQEFLTDAPPVPEPGAVVLLGTVMVAIGFFSRRRLARLQTLPVNRG
jgi:hypothetical protein